MSADSTAEHIDAVADLIESGHYIPGSPPERTMLARDDARRILTSTDAAVHAALAASLPTEVMLAALVDRGTLTADRERLVRACGCIANEEPAACCDPLASPHWEHRYVSRWEVAP